MDTKMMDTPHPIQKSQPNFPNSDYKDGGYT